MPTVSNTTVAESVVPDIAICASSETTNDCKSNQNNVALDTKRNNYI